MATDKPSDDSNKKEPIKQDSEESPIGSSPEGDGEPADSGEQGQAVPTPEGQAPKRKGGRKPIYATTEERKQRNRQAQAAFRERRTEYIKQLEQTINVQEQTLANLNAAHRTAADECLMLRYKNSLLERILLEKGIDVQAELQAKHGSPNFGPTHMPPNIIQPPPISRTLLNRHHSRRSNSSIAPKLEPGFSQLPPIHGANPPAGSPKSRPTPSSHAASPTTTEGFGASPASSENVGPGGMRPGMPAAAMKQPMGQMPGPSRMMPPMPGGMGQHPGQGPHAGRMGAPSVSSAPFYQTAAYQNHIEQLEQEYDAAADMMDEGGDAPETPSGPGPYPGAGYAAAAAAAAAQQHQAMSPTTTGPMEPNAATGHPQGHQHGLSMTQLLDPSIDWDPFGLSASMAFPSSFSFDTSNMR
ncbi:hypothetical protein KVR01_008465 [Diaporthe batatas]|uniref:uncharacterized protein n=1 Tax=Diaporthe batatas TaxID=748121 RepID=UPI001D03BF1B|nr:uncharacterized protein KVR01_008465 [Diaporthe batatas]KAG8161478.1 hypothetical protein KVR01_008465 [Diaporthe batatas]